MYGWEFYDVETLDKKTDNFIKVENYTTIGEAKDYIKHTLEMKCLDYNEKLVLIKRHYDNNRELNYEETLGEYDYKGEIKC